ncbi:MAG: tryptophan--tRNA ligase [Pseudomonadota bacterium]|uniref:tryptophan--tRNA ligase n=1 Tax=Thermithiobacillus tepidarius TaxID=929 RepID=UPI000411B318|nr:tryptophan--tRNA ligase [Thermithiobacillus tepidarius]
MTDAFAAGNRRILSGMRPTGRLHLGHYHGVLKNWLQLQRDYDCFFFVADWHALTTHYEDPRGIGPAAWDMLADWLAAGIDPERATLFFQSQMPEHAELHLLLSMITPLSWLERVPTYKDQIENLKDKDLSTYGFLGYPLLQSADILIYRAGHVPVGADQVAHVEITREIARRFNHIYGREPDQADKVEKSLQRMGKKAAKEYANLRTRYQEQGDAAALEAARALLAAQANVNAEEKERLLGYLEGTGKEILPEPQALLTPASKMPGLDGRKMSKSYGNTIFLREAPAAVTQKMRTMPTDPARVRRSDPGTPEKCPVWAFHQVYSDEPTQAWAHQGCTSAGIGCLECKQPIIDAVLAELAPMRERAESLAARPQYLREVVAAGQQRARIVAQETLAEVRRSMGLDFA